MCGIAGFNFENKEKAEEILLSLKHRGPDQDGIYADDKITLCHTRLSILDLSEAGRQPIESEDGDTVIVFNGEIYNYEELRKELIHKYNFKSRSDTEVLLYGYKEFGISFFERLRGMWAFAIYDKKKNLLIFSRDFFGIKPLLYSIIDKKIYFASEFKIIFNLLAPSFNDLDKDAYGYYFQFGYFPAPHTPYRTIKKLKPGEILIYDLNNSAVNFEKLKWEEEEFFLNKDGVSNDSILENFKKVFKDSIKHHFVSDVPVSFLFSGGNDSSLIAAVSRDLGFDPTAFHFQIENKSDPVYAQEISRRLGLKMEILKAERKDVKEAYFTLMENLDEPFADISIIPSVMIYSLIKGKAKIALTGDGGDDLLCGYARHRYFKNLRGSENSKFVFNNIFKFSRLNNFSAQKYLTPFMIRLLNKLEDAGFSDITSAYLEKSALSHLNFGADFKELFYFLKNKARDLRGIPPEIFYDLFFYLPNDLTHKTDIASMASSIEARTPFLDKEIFKFLLSVYNDADKKYYHDKFLIKETLKNYLPDNLIYRKKEGFSFSLQDYLAEEIREDFEECLKLYNDKADAFGLNHGLIKKLAESKNFRELIFKKYPRFVFALISNYKFIYFELRNSAEGVSF